MRDLSGFVLSSKYSFGYRTLQCGVARVPLNAIHGSCISRTSQSSGFAVFRRCSCAVSDLLRFCWEIRRCCWSSLFIGEGPVGVAGCGGRTGRLGCRWLRIGLAIRVLGVVCPISPCVGARRQGCSRPSPTTMGHLWGKRRGCFPGISRPVGRTWP